MSEARDIATLVRQVDALAALIALPIDPAYREGVARALADLLEAVDLLAGFSIAADVEPSLIFRA